MPCLSHSLSGLPSQLRNHDSLACERFSVTGPSVVHPALTIGTGARSFALAIAESALAIAESACLQSHHGTVLSGKSENRNRKSNTVKRNKIVKKNNLILDRGGDLE